MPRRNGRAKPAQPAQEAVPGITRISVAGFKSIVEEQSAEIRPLTILAGANSSGKSSLMQPLLLMKQTLEAPYDPGALKLNGPNVTFTSAEEFLPPGSDADGGASLTVSLAMANVRSDMTDLAVRARYVANGAGALSVAEVAATASKWGTAVLTPSMDEQAVRAVVARTHEVDQAVLQFGHAGVSRERCFLQASVYRGPTDEQGGVQLHGLVPAYHHTVYLQQMLHLPGLRDNPARQYDVAAVGDTFPGTFEKYFASVLCHWHELDADEMPGVCGDLEWLGLTWTVEARRVSGAQIELRVGRLPRRQTGDGGTVNIADVGLGVSQVLPVLVALRVAKPGQLVYLEQPEIHLHPRAQVLLADILANAAKRGVRVVVETHSSLLLTGVQTLVAEGTLDPALVKLHWFQRAKGSGVTRIRSADLDDEGAFGDWPEDFGDVELDSTKAYLDAVAARRRERMLAR